MNGLQAAFSGYIGKDCEVRTTRVGKPWASFPVAVTTDRDNEAATSWVKVSVFGDTVATLAPMLLKGREVYCQGRLTLRNWTGADGKERGGAFPCDRCGHGNGRRGKGEGMNILEAVSDPALLAPFLKDGESWAPWRTFLGALFGLPVEDEALFVRCAGGRPLPTVQAREAFLIVGRRGGKSFVAALIGVYLACFRTYKLSPGESGVVMLLAADRAQARVVFRYVRAFLEGVPVLKTMIENVTADSVTLNNGITIEVHTASFRSVRGYTVCAALCDEIAFWRSDESANPDTEILNALRPAMATIENGLLLCLSTPYSRSGALWHAHKRYFGRPGDVLIWQADTRTMNPSVPQTVIDNAFEEDPASAAAEFGAAFRSDLEAFVTQEAVDACIVPNRSAREVPAAELRPKRSTGSSVTPLARAVLDYQVAAIREALMKRRLRISSSAGTDL